MSALPPKADIRTWPVTFGCNNCGSFAIFAAIRRASLRVSFVVLCVMVLCVPMVPLAGTSLLLGV